MTFHAQIASPLGPVLLCSEGACLSGLYFIGQSDCPVINGMPAYKPHSGGPSAGMMDGLAIKNFRASKRDAEADLFSQAAACLEQKGATADLQANVGAPDAASAEMSEMLLMQADTPAATVALFERTRKELAEYFAGQRQTFDIPLALSGTVFQKKVWDALRTISYGQTVSYGDVARTAGFSAQHSRPVGAAVGRNPITIIIPCHRVLSGTGTLTGYTGGLERKVALLELEGFALQ
ncbi:methylated-DNA--[protein]-cysteine S-methyltransferase [Paralcaligenes ureilyticus]|uniref:Methylated-DNA--protein-cysteine methyltransferase n=1 Tax=Paralcaligenes ureilyticus TaxID=627131 RepID=A0A4V2UZ66_9BURK|nr:methylated-DNA--[protein]-cysteine S-methyltransferase [Paralcaligenes ureilyticus]TCT10068.1 methylated-DNA-[protein]-cysteine S-methyltransferase [Paralcaligenes ureilyticus]